MQKPKLTMTSLEAAALISSNGATDDVETANMMANGIILDPDALERAYYRRIFGFDFTIITDEEKHQVIVRDEEFNISVTCALVADTTEQAAKIAKACIKLKAKHAKYLETIEGEVV